ncbi:MAG TPA: sigma-54 dependent transcriptional regulator, partial [Acidobacteriota bacterium]|nr:sigma-54 dependent transcriptional regulator [Acidobacteriota bacterium]
MSPKKVLLVEDDQLLRGQISLALSGEYQVVEAGDRTAAELLIHQEQPDLALLDLHLPPSGNVKEGLGLVEMIRNNYPHCVVIVMSGDADLSSVLRAVDAGAYDFFRKPFDFAELKLIMRRALEKQALALENIRLREELQRKYSFASMVGQSAAMQRVFEAIRRVCQSTTTVIIRGESGTGKELIARAIHYQGPRSRGPFVSINCAALPESLVESELFGHEKGAFTGAVASHPGKFESANGGTIFLDEIGAVPLPVQAKLLRVLEERAFERVGGNRRISTDVRLITATNEDLEAKVRRDTFREDLYYRIQVFSISVPPLRERPEDIPLLFDHFLRSYSKERPNAPRNLDPAALNALMAYSWRGNIREMENLVQTLLLTVDRPTIRREDLPSHIFGGDTPVEPIIGESLNLDEAVQRYEQQLIRSALQKSNG